jgi:hypothetical protein
MPARQAASADQTAGAGQAGSADGYMSAGQAVSAGQTDPVDRVERFERADGAGPGPAGEGSRVRRRRPADWAMLRTRSLPRSGRPPPIRSGTSSLSAMPAPPGDPIGADRLKGATRLRAPPATEHPAT